MKKEIQLQELLTRYRKGTASPDERALAENWYNAHAQEHENVISAEELALAKAKIWMGVDSSISRYKPIKLWRRIAAAAAIILVVGIGYIYYDKDKLVQDLDQAAFENKILPGTSTATLTLASGKEINLSDAGSGAIADQGNVKIIKNAKGELLYEFSGSGASVTGFNTVTTPKGGQYMVALADGSKVWLNAASSLKFPVNFTAVAQRKVELSGEGYFEIAKDASRPFLVVSAGQVVEVLGTHFNVNSYGDGGNVKTTLLEGSVRLKLGKSAKVLVPGQQAIARENEALRVLDVDASDVVAWKNGYFMFNNESLENIMLSIARWYDVDIQFKDEAIKDDPFWGKVGRFSKVADVLRVLERTGEVHFRIEGRKIIVSK